MKFYLKIFLASLLCFSLMIGSGIYAFNKYYVDNTEDLTDEEVLKVTNPDQESTEQNEQTNNKDEEEIEKKSKLEKLIEDSNRVNVLAFGTDGGRADTIMFISYDYVNQLVDVVSIPRDTYHKVDGFDALGQHKINAVYGFKDVGGSKGMKYFTEKFLGVPIDYYVKVNYSGVASVIDVVGGVQVNIPFKMDYDDEWAEPPLHIHFEPGLQLLNGEDSVKYLRWRKNNDETGAGDLKRIDRQQDFVKKFLSKALGLDLPKVVKTSLNYVFTDMPADKMIYYASKARNFDMGNLKTYKIPGRAGENGQGLYIHDPEELEKMFEQIYSRGNKE